MKQGLTLNIFKGKLVRKKNRERRCWELWRTKSLKLRNWRELLLIRRKKVKARRRGLGRSGNANVKSWRKKGLSGMICIRHCRKRYSQWSFNLTIEKANCRWHLEDRLKGVTRVVHIKVQMVSRYILMEAKIITKWSNYRSSWRLKKKR